ncbi:CHAT domain-containing protein [Geitlerinema sp. CS-897]|nr:CHAT domain-containing protein [Geitlerinema sp. CS-897]
MARIELILRQSGTTDRLDADLVIFDEEGYPTQVVDSLTPLPESLSQSIEQWQGVFSNLVGAGRGIKIVSVTSGSCSDRAEEVREKFVAWLRSQESWRRLQNCINQYVSSNEEVQINIQTLDKRLRLLPWNEIFLETHRYAETSISLARQFQRRSNLKPKKQVRILAVLGSNGDVRNRLENTEANLSIDIDFDYKQLEKTQARGAYIQTFKQPTSLELKEALREPEGWHIFFFAGHSKSQNDSTIGAIALNDCEQYLSIQELKEDLSVAIENGLQIAIFNSCDGLGLAHQLAEIHLPQSIIMREPVPDEVAKEFLEQFLDFFSYSNSLFESVRRAREYLRKKFDRQSKFPGASWLPTIVRNPAVKLPLWNDFIAESPLPWKQLLPLSVLTITSLFSLFLSLFLEFKDINIAGRPKYIYYSQLYPHLVLYPWLFLWGAYFTLYKAWCQVRSKPKLWRQVVAAIGVSIVLLCVELTSDNMMLFELKEGAESVVTIGQDRIEIISKAPARIIDTSSLIDSSQNEITIRKSDLEMALENFRSNEDSVLLLSEEEKTGYYEFMRLGLAYSTWKGRGAFSRSRPFYALAFLDIIAVIIASGIFWKEIGSNYVYNRIKYLRYIMATQLLLILWFPLRIYNNIEVKKLIFGYDSSVSGLDVIAYPVLLALMAVTIYRSWKFEASYFAGIVALLAVLGSILISIVNPEIVHLAFGLNSNPSSWGLWPILILTIIYLIYSDIFAKHERR